MLTVHTMYTILDTATAPQGDTWSMESMNGYAVITVYSRKVGRLMPERREYRISSETLRTLTEDDFRLRVAALAKAG